MMKPAKQDLITIHAKCLFNIIDNDLDNDEQRLKAFYHLAKLSVLGYPPRAATAVAIEAIDLGKKLLEGVSTDRFVKFFPPDKTYDGARWECKDYFTTMQAVKEHGPVITDSFSFLWEYNNMLTRLYVVNQMCTMSEIIRQETGKEPIEEFFGITPRYLREVNGKEFLYDPKTGKTQAVTRPKRRRPKWIKLVKGGRG